MLEQRDVKDHFRIEVYCSVQPRPLTVNFDSGFVDRSFAMYAPAMKAAVDVLIDEDLKTAEAVAKEFQTRETNYNHESMKQTEIESIFEQLLHEV
ncbi:hypothetical protein HSB1_38600 [Halogranum salarium B-1]|uniref:Uncharacterized protein n=2 Tax=Halogranum rubrum TaxID=553466 RepID=J2ZAU6_9EURY|nr:hypothetical protein HSB1_38600 [Halogranum salarium B-1]